MKSLTPGGTYTQVKGSEHLVATVSKREGVTPSNVKTSKRPRQDSNLRHRLRRAIRFVQPVFSVRSGAAELGLPSTQLVAVFPVAPV